MSKRVVVYHAGHGCDTGCCGHWVVLEDGDTEQTDFSFSHPGNEDPLEYAKDLVREAFGEEHVADLDWERCEIFND